MTVTPSSQLVTVKSYGYIMLENGNIVPILNVEPEVKALTGRPIKAVPIYTWVEFNTIHPEIGNRLVIDVNNYGVTGIKNIDIEPNTLPLPIPKECPLCGAFLGHNPFKDNTLTIRCNNDLCEYWNIKRIQRYVTYCSLVVDFTYRDILKLYNTGIVKNIVDLYKLTTKDIVNNLEFNSETAKRIVNNIKQNVNIPIQNLIYAIKSDIDTKVAIKLSSLITDKWYDGIKELSNNSYISIKDKKESMLKTIILMLNQHLEKVKNVYMELATIIKVTYLPVKQFLGGKLIVIDNLVNIPREYLETVIKLNGGRVDDNYISIVWNHVDYIISTGIETNERIIQAIKYGITKKSEDEFRTILDCKIANEPDINRNEGL